MAKFTGTDLPQLSNGSDDVAVKKSILDLLDKINTVSDSAYPVGATYTQYAGQTAPATLFGGTWVDITTSLPTQVYDSGSNANGSWIRYTDGTMICYEVGTIYYPLNIVTATNFYASALITRTFPQAFISNPSLITSVGQQSVYGYQWVTGDGYFTTTQLINYRLFSPLASAGTALGTLNYTATGKWSSAPVYPVTLWKRTGGSLNQATGTSVVTGIYDSGTNSNGSWIRFTDGTMMQWGTFASTTYPQAMLFPIPFVDTTYRLIPVHSETGTANIVSNISPATVTVSGCSVWSNVGNTAAQRLSGSVDWHAIGKWK